MHTRSSELKVYTDVKLLVLLLGRQARQFTVRITARNGGMSSYLLPRFQI